MYVARAREEGSNLKWLEVKCLDKESNIFFTINKVKIFSINIKYCNPILRG